MIHRVRLISLVVACILWATGVNAQTSGWVFPTTSSYTATSADNGKVLVTDNVPGATITVTLPTPSVVGAGWLMGFGEGGGHGIVANTPSGSIFILAGQKTLTSLSVASNTNYEYFALESDGTNFRLLVATNKISYLNGLLGTSGGQSWTYLFSTGYSATPGDNGSTLSSSLAGGPVTITLPSTPLIPNGWTIDVAADVNNVTVTVNGVSGGTILKSNKTSGSNQPVQAGSYMRLYYTGTVFEASIRTPGVQTFYPTANTTWGQTGSLTSVAGGVNGSVGATVNNLAPATTAFPTGTTGYGIVYPGATGNVVFGMYGEADLTTNGTAIGGEIDCMNYSGTPDTGLPPNKAIGTSTNACVGLQIGAGGTSNSSVGLIINGALGGVFATGANQRFNTGIYMGGGLVPGTGGATQYGVFIDADATGPSTTMVLQNYGNGINLQLGTTGAMQGLNSIIATVDSSGIAHFGVRQNGAVFMGNNATTIAPINNRHSPPTRVIR